MFMMNVFPASCVVPPSIGAEPQLSFATRV